MEHGVLGLSREEVRPSAFLAAVSFPIGPLRHGVDDGVSSGRFKGFDRGEGLAVSQCLRRTAKRARSPPLPL